MGFTIHITNNCPQVMAALANAKQRALESCGAKAEEYAKNEITAQNAVDTGNLRNSITYQLVDENTVQIGTDCEYAVYVECGTGPYSTVGGGTAKEYWHYQNPRNGQWYTGHPMPARPYLKPAVADHADEYNKIIEDSFRNA